MLASLKSQHPFALLGVGFLLFLIASFYHDSVKFRKAHSEGQSLRQRPPKYPTWVPYLGSLIPFILDGQNYLHRATSFAGQLTSSRAAFFPWLDLYFFQDRKTVQEIWRQSSLLSTDYLRFFALKRLFGLPSKWLVLYQPNSNVSQAAGHLRHDLHVVLLKALIGSGSAPMFARFQASLTKNLQIAGRQVNWVQNNDFWHFLHQTVGFALVEAVFGPTFLELNPTFIADIFTFNESIPWMSKGLPQFLKPGPYRARRKLLEAFKNWYQYSREHFHESTIAENGDEDPFWGCALIRDRQRLIGAFNDDDMMASLDLGLACGLTLNMVPLVGMALIHLFENQPVLDRVREEIQVAYGKCPTVEFDLERLSSMPLLHSIYAETLRLHATSFTIVSAPNNEVALGKWHLPKGGMGIISPEICHKDPNFWNTQGGLHPLQSFWAERFITDPSDPSSGPILPSVATQPLMRGKKLNSGNTKPFVSMKGLDGSWIPYSGGQLICPGRFLAQKVIMYTCILLASEFDIRLSTNSTRFKKKKYGIGALEPEDKICYFVKAREKTDGTVQ